MANAKSLLPVLSYVQAAEAVAACIRARRTAMVYGPPGIGKTSLAREVSGGLDLPCRDMIASNFDPTDIAGLPFRDPNTGHVLREVFPEIQKCIESPGLLFLDEATTMQKSVEGPCMRLALERNAGGTPLHPDSRILLAANAPEHAPGASELTAAMTNRLVLLRYMPTMDEITDYFAGRPASGVDTIRKNVLSEEAFQEMRKVEWADFAATLGSAGDLLQLEPPAAAVDAGEPWGSPRAWEIGLDCYAALGREASSGGKAKGDTYEDEVGYAVLAGAVGPHAASGYLAIRALRSELPTINEILNNPEKATVPDKKDYQIASLGLVARCGDKDSAAAWIYAGRLNVEYGAAAARVLMQKPPNPASKWHNKSRQVQLELLAKVTRKSRG